jgi:prepilin-type N-terminal cleavage/methylation domain-containing protein
MRERALRKSAGFTLIEMAIVLGVLGAVLLVSATLLSGTMSTYAQLTTETETIKKARHCLEMMSRDVRESVNFDIQDPNPDPAGPLVTTIDAMLLTSSRRSNNTFSVDGNNFPQPESIVLYYLNVTAEGIPQLMRHQLFYVEDLGPFGFVPPYTLAPPPGPYVGPNIVIIDNVGNIIALNRVTGGSGGVMPLMAPKVMMTGSTSLDMVGLAPNPIQAQLTCQFTDRYGRVTATRLGTTITPRNL